MNDGITRTNRPHGRRACLVCTMAAVLAILGDDSVAQLRSRNYGQPTPVRMPEPPRELRRALTKAEQAIDDGQYSDAVAILNRLLEPSDDQRVERPRGAEDYFLDPSETSTVTDSLKRKALRLLGTMPPDGREIVELQLGRDARRQLKRALQDSDAAALQEVSRRYFHTEAGYEATYLLARYHMDHLRPLAAALQFKRLREAESAKKYEPELSLLYAACLMSADQEDEAKGALIALRDEYPSARFEITGESISMPSGDVDLVRWISALVGHWQLASNTRVANWTMARGTPDRNGSPEGGMPLAKMEFHVDATAFVNDGERIATFAANLRDQSRHALPVLEPLAVGTHVLMRTPRLTYGVDLTTGLRTWPYPWNRAERIKSMAAGDVQAAALLTQRMFTDATYGRMSSDGNALFVIIDPQVDAGEKTKRMQTPLQNLRLFQTGQIERPTNQLAAIDLAAEGKSLWIIGGTDSDEPRLAGAYFLGAPLPLDGHLYVIAEWKDEIKLVVLDAESGALMWAQQLAEVDASSSFYYNSHLRTSGCTPAYSNGILVCPTASGALVAVDVATRSLLWGYPYKIENPIPTANFRSSHLMTLQPGNRWADNIPIISSGTVVHTPVASNRLHCINLLTGESRWRPRLRASELCVAGVVGDQIISVTYNGARATDAASGKATWQTTLQRKAKPSGRGFVSGGALFLPTTDREVVKIDLTDGKIEETVKTDYVLGNLICHGDYVISQNYDALRVFRLRDQTRTAVNQRLAENPNDDEALEDHISILIGAGKSEKALSVMRKLARILAAETAGIDSSDDRDLERLGALRRQQTRLMLDLLEQDHDKHQALSEELLELAMTPDELRRFRYLLADYQFRKQDYREAFGEYVKLLTALGQENGDDESDQRQRQLDAMVHTEDSDWSVSKERWIAVRLRTMLAGANEHDRAAMLRLVEQCIADAIADDDIERMRIWWHCLPSAPNIDRAQLAGAKIAITNGEYLRADMALSEVDPKSPLATEALAQRALMLSRQGSVPLATAAFLQLAKTATDTPLSGGQTGKAMFDDFVARQGDQVRLRGFDRWNRGKVVRLKQPALRVEPVSNGLRFTEVRESSGDWPESYRVAFEFRSNLRESGSILVYDGYGALVTRVPFNVMKNGFAVLNQPRAQFAKTYGNLLVLSIGTEVVAIDVISEVGSPRERILWTSDRREAPTANRAMPFGTNPPHTPSNKSIPFTVETIDHTTIGDELMGQLGPVGKHGVCYINDGDLYCVDALNGRPNWVRRNVGTKAEIYGDDDYVFVIDQKAKLATVFETSTGAALGKRQAPLASRRWRKIGRSILTWDSGGSARPFKIRLFDSWLEKDIWSYEFANRSRGCMVGNDELAMLTPNGEFSVIRVSDGKRLIQEKLEGSLTVATRIAVHRSPEDYVLLVHGKNDARLSRLAKRKFQIYTPTVAGQQPPLITGHVYCFDRQTGKSRWPHPLEVNEFGFAPNHPADVPVLAFARNVTLRTNPQRRFGALVCLDRRTGDLLFANYRIPQFLQTFFMRGDPDEQTVNVQVGNDVTKDYSTIALKFTDLPRTRTAVQRLAPVARDPKKSDEEKEGTKKTEPKALDNLFGAVR